MGGQPSPKGPSGPILQHENVTVTITDESVVVVVGNRAPIVINRASGEVED